MRSEERDLLPIPDPPSGASKYVPLYVFVHLESFSYNATQLSELSEVNRNQLPDEGRFKKKEEELIHQIFAVYFVLIHY